MASVVIRVLISLILGYVAALCVTATIGVWRIPIDEALTLRAMIRPIQRALAAPIGVTKVLQVRGLVDVDLSPRSSTVTVQPQGQAVVATSELQGTTNYTLLVRNRNAFPLLDAHVRVQLPFSIVTQTVCRRDLLQGLELALLTSPWDITAPDGGSVTFPRAPRSPHTEIRIARVEPHGYLEVALLLDTASTVWLEPMPGFKESDGVRFFVELTYYRQVGDESVSRTQFHRVGIPGAGLLTLGPAEATPPRVLEDGSIDF